MNPFLRSPGSPLSTTGRIGQGTAGRPKSTSKFSLRATGDVHAGFVQLNTKPEVLQQVQRKYLNQQQLPPSLLPSHMQPSVLRTMKNKNISRGWKKPKDGRR